MKASPNHHRVGEENAFPFKLNTAEIYNPATGLWSTTGTLNTARGHPTATLLSIRQVLVVGGSFSSSMSKVILLIVQVHHVHSAKHSLKLFQILWHLRRMDTQAATEVFNEISN